MNARAAGRRPFVCGNWKMFKTTGPARALAREIANGLRGESGAAEVCICPPFTALAAVAETLRDTPVAWGAQNCAAAPEGALTG